MAGGVACAHSAGDVSALLEHTVVTASPGVASINGYSERQRVAPRLLKMADPDAVCSKSSGEGAALRDSGLKSKLSTTQPRGFLLNAEIDFSTPNKDTLKFIH